MPNITKYSKYIRTLKISKNFYVSEFHCKCKSQDCYETPISDDLVVVLQLIRNHFKRSITINCAYRCEQHNKDVGGVKSSQHLLGSAADIIVDGVSPQKVQEYLIIQQNNLNVTIGRYDNFTHIDVRENPIIFDQRKNHGN